MLAFLTFVAVMLIAAAGLLLNHVAGLRSRVELQASGLMIQQSRLIRFEDQLVSATDDRSRMEAELDLASARSRVEMCADLHRVALESYTKAMKTFPTSVLKAQFPLTEPASAARAVEPFPVIDLTDSATSLLTFSRSVVQLP